MVTGFLRQMRSSATFEKSKQRHAHECAADFFVPKLREPLHLHHLHMLRPASAVNTLTSEVSCCPRRPPAVPQYRVAGIEVIPPPEVLPEATTRLLHPDHVGHVRTPGLGP